jgi:hypothetical protein
MDYDLIVIGGGPAGIGTAISGAKNGLKTAIIERHSILGGNWTNGYVLSILGVYTYDGSQKIVGGIVDEIVEELEKVGGSKGQSGNFIPFRPDEMKMVLGNITNNYGIDLYTNSLVTGVEVNNNSISAIIVAGKDGEKKLSAKFYADTSGDADAAMLAGLGTSSGEESTGLHQEATMPFRISGIDVEEVVKFSEQNPNMIEVVMNGGLLERVRIKPVLVEKAKIDHELYLPHANSEFLFCTSKEGEFVCNATHVPVDDFTSGKEIAKISIDARMQILSSLHFLKKNINGFENSYLVDSAAYIGLRETRRAGGEYILKESDVLGNARFEDAIARCGHPLEIHTARGEVVYRHLNGGDGSWYHIPFGSIVVRGINNLFVAGRCLSAEFNAQASARVTGTALAMGHAVGVAAMLAIKYDLPAKEVNVKELQSILKAQGAIM